MATTIPRKKLTEIAERLRLGSSLGAETRALGFKNNKPLRAALRDLYGREGYEALMRARRNSLPALLDTARVTFNDVAEWAGVSRNVPRYWREGKLLPQPAKRRALVKAVRDHARRLRALADKVEREGEARGAHAKERFTDWGPDTVKVVSVPKRRGPHR